MTESIKNWENWPNAFKFQSTSILAIHSTRQQETVSVTHNSPIQNHTCSLKTSQDLPSHINNFMAYQWTNVVSSLSILNLYVLLLYQNHKLADHLCKLLYMTCFDYCIVFYEDNQQVNDCDKDPQHMKATFLLQSTASMRKNKHSFTNKSVVMSTRLEPERNSFMITSLSFWSMSPCYKT